MRAFLIAAAMVLGTTALAIGVDFSDPAFAQTGSATSIPVGHAEFCQTYRDQCGPNLQAVAAVALTEDSWRQLVDTNSSINAGIAPVSDEDLYRVAEYWTFPSAAGDCEDYVLAKRKALAEAGWPLSTLLIAVVRQLSGEGHAVLIVRTDRGDLVLDNMDGEIHRWNETPYVYVKRQSQRDSGRWVAINDDRKEILTAAH